jgi:hypothetical protein
MTLLEASEHFRNQAEQIATVNRQFDIENHSNIDTDKLLVCCKYLLDSLAVCNISMSHLLKDMAGINNIEFNVDSEALYPAYVILPSLVNQVQSQDEYDLNLPPLDIGW